MRLSTACGASLVSAAFLWCGQAANAATETVLYSFCSHVRCLDGGLVGAPLIVAGGTFYGTTGSYGRHGDGTVFSFAPDTGMESTLHGFRSTRGDGEYPGNLLMAGPLLYGLTGGGGTDGAGTIFSLDRTTGKENVLHSFLSNGDGMEPDGSLIRVNGKLYGTTEIGGAYGYGTVFSYDPKSGTETILHAFQNDGTDGLDPCAGVIKVGRLLYGTTYIGGLHGNGTLFGIDPNTGTESVLYAFQGGNDGAEPLGGLIARKRILYGTTSSTVYSFSLETGAETVLHQFAGEADGYQPMGNLIEHRGILYGTTSFGGGTDCGGEGCGTVFSVDPDTGAETVLHAFQNNGKDGTWPFARLVAYRNALYGTTHFGGTHRYGTIFKITP